MTARGRLALLLAALAALLGPASSASGAPALGRWEATRADGRGLTFTVVRTAFGTAIRDVAGHCPNRAEARNGTTSSYEPRSGPPGDRKPTLNPVDARGRIRAVVRPRFFEPLEGRLGRSRGTVRLKSSWQDSAPIDSCNVNDPVIRRLRERQRDASDGAGSPWLVFVREPDQLGVER